jgi:hypothetical protein
MQWQNFSPPPPPHTLLVLERRAHPLLESCLSARRRIPKPPKYMLFILKIITRSHSRARSAKLFSSNAFMRRFKRFLSILIKLIK